MNAPSLPSTPGSTGVRSAGRAPVGDTVTSDRSGEPVDGTMRDFDEFYARHRDEIGRALVFVLGDRSLGQEAVDEAMVKAYQQWDKIGDTENPAGWVFVVGKRWGLSWRRGRRRERRREELLAARTDRGPDRSADDLVDLMGALEELTADQRTVVVCRFSLGLSVEETADLLGLREGTVKSRLSRAVDRLRALTETGS